MEKITGTSNTYSKVTSKNTSTNDVILEKRYNNFLWFIWSILILGSIISFGLNNFLFGFGLLAICLFISITRTLYYQEKLDKINYN